MNNPNVITTPEGLYVLKNDTHISRWVEKHKSLICDPYLFKWLDPFIDGSKVIWDVGAFIGDHTAHYLKITGVVHAFEPNPDAFYCLKRNLEAFEFPHLKCWNLAASDTHGKIQMNLDENAGASHIVSAGTVERPCAPLDSLDIPDPDFIKLDVEGWEMRALEGMTETLERARPKVLVEINSGALARNRVTPRNIFEFFEQLNYSSLELYPLNVSLTEPQYDALFLP